MALILEETTFALGAEEGQPVGSLRTRIRTHLRQIVRHYFVLSSPHIFEEADQ